MREYRLIPAQGKLNIPTQSRQALMFFTLQELYAKIKKEATNQNKSLGRVRTELLSFALNRNNTVA